MVVAWRVVFFLAVLGMIGPAVAALAVVGLAGLLGCAPDDLSCGTGLGEALAFTLEWAWRRLLDLRVLGLLTAVAATGAAFGFAPRRRAVMWAFIGACWGCIAALILPYAAVVWSAPADCRIAGQGVSGCLVWGHPMGDAYRLAAGAFWSSVFIIPISLGGVALSFGLATLRTRWNPRPPGPI